MSLMSSPRPREPLVHAVHPCACCRVASVTTSSFFCIRSALCTGCSIERARCHLRTLCALEAALRGVGWGLPRASMGEWSRSHISKVDEKMESRALQVVLRGRDCSPRSAMACAGWHVLEPGPPGAHAQRWMPEG